MIEAAVESSISGGSNYKYDAILVLGAVMQWHSDRRRWEFPTFIKQYPALHVAGNMRAAAASLIQHEAPLILVTGGSDTHPETGITVSRSQMLGRLMIERFQVPEDKVVAMGTLARSTTKGNLTDIADYLKGHPRIYRLVIISPRFQAMRSKDIFSTLPQETGRALEVTWRLAERIIEEKYPEFRETYSKPVYRSAPALFCAAMERRGRADMKEGKYTKVNPDETPKYQNLDLLNDHYDQVISQTLGFPDPF